MLTFVLVVLIVAMLVSLAISLKSLFSSAQKTSDRSGTYRWLGIRVTLAAAILIVIIVGLITGEFEFGAPWTGQY